MDSLTKQQKECLDDILKIKSNYKKDSEKRKTKTYIEVRINRLEFLWSQFSTRDIEIQKIKETNSEHPYFTKNFYSEAEKHYEAISELLTKKLEDIVENEKQAAAEKVSFGTNNSEETIELGTIEYTTKLHRVQQETLKLFNRVIDSIKAESQQTHSGFYYQHKLNTIQEYWNKITLNHNDIVANPTQTFDEYFQSNVYQATEDQYQDIIIHLQEKLSSIDRSDDDIKLPRLVIPVFDGDYQNWTSFHDIFVRLIHNNTRLGDAEKMQYLKTHIKKEASSLLQHLTISDANYKTAWQLLNDRFNNKRKLFSVQLQLLLSQPRLEQESAVGIRKLHDTTKECLHALSNLGINTDNWAPMIAHIVIQKLDFESHKLYEQGLEKPRELPTYEILFRFLENRFQSLESLKDSKKKETPTQAKISRPSKIHEWPRYKAYHSTTKSSKCPQCHQAHKIYTCQKFMALSTQERKNFIQSNKLCLNCLTHRDDEKCHSRYKCSICKQSHHTLLHQEQKTQSTSHLSTAQNRAEVQSLLSHQSHNVLLATALIKTKTIDGRVEYIRALVDPGSQASFVSESTAQLLRLPKTKAHAEISGVGLSDSGTVRHKINIELQPRFSSNFSINVEALILPRLTKLLPNRKVNYNCSSDFWQNIILADPTYGTPGPIDVIIGADIYHSIILEGMKKIDGLVAQNTEFGWILSGHTTNTNDTTITCMVSYADLDKTMNKFWEIEDVTDTSKEQLSQEDQLCEEHFQKTHVRNPDGSYTVRIPFKSNINKLGESKRRAIARLLQNEKRFSSNKTLEVNYKQFMQEYTALKHMNKIPCDQEDGYYLPHQAVIKEDSSTTKLRVVFDASSKTSTGISLNDTMYVGPKLQNDLAEILLRWRKHRYVFTADIEKMYRQIKVHERDQKYQKILWRPSIAQPIEEYCLATVTYGTASAPFLAIRTLQQLALDEKESYPQASRILSTDFYVDDLMTGADTLREARTVQKEIISLLASGGFKLRKWTSNQQHLLETIPDELREKGLQEITDGEAVKTLGVYWLPSKDCFQFKVNISPENKPATKRSTLSDISKLFDPLGWLAPVVIQAKLIMQQLWIMKVTWDTPLPPELMTKWNQFRNELPSVQTIQIYRWIKHTNNNNTMEIHGFCDASEKAYAAVVYSRVESLQGEVIVTMLAAKTKLAPINKEITLPRLELCAAVLLKRLLQKTTTALDLQQHTIFAWTDSSIALAWIKGDPSRWKTFIAHRVNEITSFIKPDTWHHIRSEDNPADCASRGINPTQLKTHPLWWTGPKWLSSPKDQWPTTQNNTFTTSRDIREQHEAFLITMKTTELIERFSELSHMIRVLTYCRRFFTCCRTKTKISGYLTTKELHSTLMQVIQMVQTESFPHDIHQLSKGKDISKSSKLHTLAPFLDRNGILRITGRLDNSLLPYNEKHPIILPHNHHFTTLVLRDAHFKTLHGGNQSTHAYVLRRYWVIDARNAIRRITHRCITCCRYRGETAKQLMGSLPTSRVVPSKPFTHTGMDYAGPFNIRVSPGRGTKIYKGYIVVFVCLSTKAIHLEAVGDMTTAAFLAAFKRFTARRGLCSDLYSDNGTTFVGARNELDKLFNQTLRKNHDEASKKLINDGTQWHFIPPAAPHFGGLWEAGVKSVKHHLRRIAGESNLTFEEFTTLLCQIEACLNSRPLCPLTSEPNDLAVITPGHFLTGNSILLPPEPAPSEKPLHCLKTMERISKLKNDFWKVWSTEYLGRLQQRPKWTRKQDNIQEGDLVLLRDETSPPARWPLGRVIKTHPGKDGLVRVAHIKTSKTVLERPIAKLCKLPFEKEELPSVDSQEHIKTKEVKKLSRKRSHTTINPTTIPLRPPIEELRRSHLPKKQAKKVTISTTASALLLLNLILPVFTNTVPILARSLTKLSPITVQEFQHNPGIYFEDLGNMHLVNDEWNTVVYYNLSTYYQQLSGFQLCLDKLKVLCNKTIVYNFYCDAILTEVTHKIQEMHQNNLILHSRTGHQISKGRQRRAPFEIIGTLQNSLFGVLDQQYATYIESEIDKLKENDEYLLTLAKNLTSITEVTANVLKKTTEDIQQQFNILNQHVTASMEELHRGVETSKIMQSFSATATYLSLIMTTYERTQKELIDLVVDTHNGKISPFLLTPIQLREEIKFIREHISSSLIIPGEGSSEDILNLYKIITIKSRITKDKIIFKIRIPLPTEGLYQLFKVYPVPTRHLSEFIYIEPSTQYLATTLHRDFSYPLTRSEIKDCVKTESLGLLCQQQHPIYSTQSSLNRCEMRLLNHNKFGSDTCTIKKTKPSKYWVQLEHRNNWIYVVDEETTINAVCGKLVVIRTLKESGIIRLNEGCTIKHQSMSITAQSIITEFRNSSFLPSTNLSSVLPKLETANEKSIQSAHLNHLDITPLENVKLTIKGNFGSKINGHHIHHYTTTYVIFLLIGLALAWYIYRRLQPCKNQKKTTEETFEVQPVTPQPAKRSIIKSAAE